MKYIAMSLLLGALGCASEPMSYEDQMERNARFQQMGNALTGLSNNLNQQSQYNQQQNYRMQQQFQQSQRVCATSPNGFGGFVTSCY